MHAGFQSNSVVQVETRAVAPPTGAEPVTHGTEYILFTKLLAAAGVSGLSRDTTLVVAVALVCPSGCN